MTLLAGAVWTVVDDDGTGETGTEFDAAFYAAVKTSIEAQIHSAANPTVEPNEIIDEVVAARGVEASLDARLDGIDADLAGVLNVSRLQNAIGLTNMVANELFLCWPYGDAIAPSYWISAGAGHSVARCGTGLADTNKKIGDFCVRLRRVAASSTLSQSILNLVSYALLADAMDGADVSFGAWVRSTGIGGARIYISDGVDTTYSAGNAAANTWEWLSLTHVCNAASTQLRVGIINDTNGADAYLSAPTFFFSDTPPARWMPTPVHYENYEFHVDGAVAVQTSRFLWMPHRPGIIKDIGLLIRVAPTGANMVVDVNTWDGAAYTTMCASKPTILAGAFVGGAQPDGTYARRCFDATPGGGPLNAGAVAIDIDAVGSGVAGSDLTVSIRALHWLRPFEGVYEYDDVGL